MIDEITDVLGIRAFVITPKLAGAAATAHVASAAKSPSVSARRSHGNGHRSVEP